MPWPSTLTGCRSLYMIGSPHFSQTRLVTKLTSSRCASEARAVLESSPFFAMVSTSPEEYRLDALGYTLVARARTAHYTTWRVRPLASSPVLGDDSPVCGCWDASDREFGPLDTDSLFF